MGRVLAGRILACMAAALAGAMGSATAQTNRPCNSIGSAEESAACDAAIAAAKGDDALVDLLFLRAYNEIDRNETEKALADLDRLLAIQPDHVRGHHERAYVFNEMGEHAKALGDLDAELRLDETRVQGYRERGYTWFFVGGLAERYADFDKALHMDAGNSSLLLDRASAAMWLGRFADARKDIEVASLIAEQGSNDKLRRGAAAAAERLQFWEARTESAARPDKLCLDADRTGKHNTPRLIGDCSAAFLAAGRNEDKADFLTVRAIAWLLADRPEEWLSDLTLAAALTPTSAKGHANLGSAYLRVPNLQFALKEFDAALTMERTWLALAGRGTAKYRLGNVAAALADCKASLEIEPNELALYTLGDIAYEQDANRDMAKTYWMAAYKLGSRDDSLIARLKTVGVGDPEKEAAKP